MAGPTEMPPGGPPSGAPELHGEAPKASIGFWILMGIQIPPDHNAAILGANVGMTVFAFVVIILRLITRILLVNNIGWDDCFAAIAVIFAIPMAALNCIATVKYGMGMHLGDITQDNETMIEKYHWITLILYPFSLGFAKLSIIFFLLRLTPNPRFAKVLYGCGAFVIALTLAVAFSVAFQCTPVAAFYDRTLMGGSHCIDRASLYFSTSAFNILTDIALCLLPIPMLLKVQLPRRQRLILIFVFAIGGFVCIASVMRLTTLYDLTRSRDPPWIMAKFSIWTACEAALAVICASIPTLKPLISRYIPRLVSSTFQSSLLGGNNNNVGSNSANKMGYNISVPQGDLRRGPSLRMSSGHRVNRGFFTAAGDDDSLEEEEMGIMKTTEVRVRVEGTDSPWTPDSPVGRVPQARLR
ncbi:hypothetical protein EDC01DRAFT_636934 [Geopyxis carbonaria]|nr:hypothetical protein EDC01DRAFT_636934 [Geopyxis carbonaria]